MEGGVGPVGSAGSNCGEDRLPRLAEDLGLDFPSVLRLGSFVNRGTSPATASPRALSPQHPHGAAPAAGPTRVCVVAAEGSECHAGRPRPGRRLCGTAARDCRSQSSGGGS